MMNFYAKKTREEKTLCVGMRCGGFSGFAAIRYGLRSVLRAMGFAATALFALKAFSGGKR